MNIYPVAGAIPATSARALSLNPHHNTLLASFYRRASVGCCNLLDSTQLVNNGLRISRGISLTPEPLSYLPPRALRCILALRATERFCMSSYC